MATYRTVKIGDESTTDFRVFFERVDASGEATIVSPFHDIPLHAGEGVFNMVVEIPRGTNAKLEIATGEKMNPIKQDVKKGALRFVGDVAPYSGYIWNYGAFPQTWEDPTYLHPETNAYGDKDPLDVCEIGSAPGHTGQVKQVKVLGIIAMIDEGETDWKVLVVDVTDPLAAQLNDLDDVQRLLPGITQATYEWLRTYKMSSGAAPNTFGYDGAAKNKAFALHIIQENHEFWKQVSSGKKPAKGEKYDLALANTTLAATETPYKVAAADARSAVKDLPHKAREAAAAAAPAAAAATTAAATPIKAAVEASQRAHPHASGELGAFLQEIAAGSRPAASPSGLLSVSFGAVGDVTTFGVYQKNRGHGLVAGLAAQVIAQGVEQVAAGYIDGTTVVITTGYGRHSFAAGAAAATADDGSRARALYESAKADANLLGVTAPLALLSA